MVKTDARAWFDVFFRRMTPLVPDIRERVLVLPRMPLHQFIALFARADAVLDTWPFSGGNSSYEAFAAGAPVVTMPGPTMCGRLTAAFYKQMGLDGFISQNRESYVRRAVSLANDRPFRVEQSALIRERDRLIFEDQTALALLENVFADLVRCA
jgi:predicted O-linked N-acetylglucosamine transferase (SPINDLY family)